MDIVSGKMAVILEVEEAVLKKEAECCAEVLTGSAFFAVCKETVRKHES